MRDHERRQLLVIEKHLLAEAPELAELFDRLPKIPRSGKGRRVVGWLAAALLLLGVVLGEGWLLLGALALAGVSGLGWTVQTAGSDHGDGRRR